MAEQFDENGNARESEPVWSGMKSMAPGGYRGAGGSGGDNMGYGYRQQILADHLTAQQSMATRRSTKCKGN